MNEIKDIEMISIQPYNSSFSLVPDSSNANAKTVRIENVYNWSRFFFVSFNIESLLACSSQHDESKTSVNTWTGLFLVSFPRTFNNWVFSIFDFVQLNSSNSKKKNYDEFREKFHPVKVPSNVEHFEALLWEFRYYEIPKHSWLQHSWRLLYIVRHQPIDLH